MIDRKTLVAEQLIREYVRERIQSKMEEKALQEAQLRSIIRKMLILETETGTEEPSTYTGINVLADLLKNIVPTIEDDYKMLTTSADQRESFKKHLVHAVKGALRPIEVTADVEDLQAEELEIDAELLGEKVTVDILDDEEEAESLEGEFIDIDADKEKEDDFVEISDQNETGRNFAADSFKRVEKQIVDAYDMLADDQDRDLFYDYLLTNLLLYFDKFEAELSNTLPDVTTPEYEEEKDDLDLGSEEDPFGEEEEELDLDLDF
jgi:hypothetical protein